jgi:hypothetical protein
MLKVAFATLVATALTIVAPVVSSANPRLSLSWDGCPGSKQINRSRFDGTTANVVVTAQGFDSEVVGISVWIGVSAKGQGLPDAWRFDADGCNAGHAQTLQAAAGPGCPFLPGFNLAIPTEYKYETQGGYYYAAQHDPSPLNAATSYTLAQFQFDMSAAFAGLGTKPDSCGCLDEPVCIHLFQASWVGTDGIERPFTIAQDYLNWEDPANSVACPYGCELCPPGTPPDPPNHCVADTPTPAGSRTWGQVKAFYR